MSVDEDLGGLWSGEYRYSGLDVAVPFTAIITEDGGQFRGITLEPATFGPVREGEYEASIRGDRVGQHLWFSKLYDPSTGIQQPPLLYSGSVDSSFRLITGRWVLPDETDRIHGTFSLSRVAKAL